MNTNFTNIPQLDGVDDSLVSTPGMSLSGMSSPQQHSARPHHSLIKNYTLKQSKQFSRLVNDTTIEDFDITVSPVAHNVNIKCSTGFYSLVVLPAFSTISESFRNIVDDILIRVSSIKGHFDNADSNVAGVIVFTLECKEGKNIGSVTMHLHYTSRLLQLQGSSLVHGRSRAPVWFVNNVIHNTFNYLAEEKKVDISNFNKKVRDILGSKPKSKESLKCYACNRPLDRRTAPEFCSICNQSYHKKCVDTDLHKCKTNIPGRPMPQLVDLDAMPRTTNSSDSNCVLQAPSEVHKIVHPSNQYSTLDPNAPPFNHPVGIPSIPNEWQDNNKTNRNKQPASKRATKTKTSKHTPPIQPEAIQAEFSKVELNAAQTRIVELENEVKRLKQSNFIFEERIKYFEESQRKNIHDRYFTDNEPQSQCYSQFYSGINSCFGNNCPRAQPSCCAHKTSNHTCPSTSLINNIQHKIEVNAQNIQDIRSELIVISTAQKGLSSKETDVVPNSFTSLPGATGISSSGSANPELNLPPLPSSGAENSEIPLLIDSDISEENDDQTVIPLN